MDKKEQLVNGASEAALTAIAGMSAHELGRALLLTVALSKDVVAAMADDTLGRWAEFGFSPAALFCATRALCGGVAQPMLVRDSPLHPLRLLILGAEAAIVELRIGAAVAASAAVVQGGMVSQSGMGTLYAVLVQMMKHYAVHGGRLGVGGNVWRLCTGGDDALTRDALYYFGSQLRNAMGARMGWDEDRWAAVWFATCAPRAVDEAFLRRAYSSLLIAKRARGAVGIGAPAKKKKVVRKSTEQSKQ